MCKVKVFVDNEVIEEEALDTVRDAHKKAYDAAIYYRSLRVIYKHISRRHDYDGEIAIVIETPYYRLENVI